MKAFEPIKEQLKASYNKVIAASQMSCVAHLSTDDKPAAKSALNTFATAVITGGEALQGEGTYSGTIHIKVMYESEQCCAEHIAYQSNFSGKLTSKEFQAGMPIDFMCKVIECKVEDLSSDSITVNCQIAIEAICLVENCVDYVNDGVGDIFVKKCEDTCCHVLSKAKGYFTACKEIDVKDLVRGITSTCGTGLVQSVSTGLDCAVAQGDFYIQLSYRTGDENCNIKVMQLEVPFKDEMTLTGAIVGNDASCELAIKCIKVTAEVDEEKGKSKIIINIEYCLDCSAYCEDTFESVVDAFSLKYDLNLQKKQIECVCYNGKLSLNERVNCSKEIQDCEIDKIIGVLCSYADVTDSYVADGQICVEGIACCNVLYSAEDSLQTVMISSPFSLKTAFDEKCEMKIKPYCAVSACDVKHKRTKQIDITFEIECSIDCFTICCKQVVTDIDVICEKKPCMHSIEVYNCGEGESLWSVSKELLASPDEIAAQNKDVQFPTKRNEKILIYRKM